MPPPPWDSPWGWPWDWPWHWPSPWHWRWPSPSPPWIEEYARNAENSARDAEKSASGAKKSASDAEKSASGAKKSASDAEKSAREAEKSASIAKKSARDVRRILIGVGAIVVLVLFAIFLAWIILRPTKPEFVLQATTLNALSLSQASILTTSMQITISIRNPNERIGIYYEQVGIYVSYRNQKITETTELPPCIYMGHNEITAWSLFLNGTVPIAPYLAAAMCEDFNGDIVLNIKVSARLKWKVGTRMFGNHRLIVKWSSVFYLQQTRWVSSFGGGKVSV